MKSVVIDFKNSLPFFPLIRDVVAQWEFVQVFTPFISLNVGNVLYVQVCFEFYIKKESKFASKKTRKVIILMAMIFCPCWYLCNEM